VCSSDLDDPVLQYSVSIAFSLFKHPPSNQVIGTLVNRNQNKIRIGYFSPDFKDHPVAALTVELFELHNRDQFEIIAFSFCGFSDSVLGLRLQEAFDQFIDVSSMSDIEIAQLSANLGIDIAVDLCGHTAQSRTGIFAHRAAPIQVNYLGYPGTMGAPYFDYIIADKTLIPRESFNFYSEKIVYLPHTYQVNDRSRTISDRRFTKQELGLPETGFIFCCFNNNFKILPEMFNSWMRILLSVEKSTLWLFEDNPWAADNLKKEAAKRGVAPERLIFAQKLPRAEHLARHLYADLFLDTYPYNAHTTASDALWVGLPVLTLMGDSFASRVAASLLNAVNLPELITTNQADYESLAINLATHPQKLNALKQKLISDRLTSPLFNTALFTENIEKVYLQMHKRYQSKFKPDHMLNEW
jgi:predicted O-linked N-acetylglucosamine transferase (SPINDLY family)